MLLKNKSSNKSQLALMAGLTLGTITTPTLVNAVHASPSIAQAVKQSPFNITNLVTINASASVVKNVPANSYGVDVSDYQGNDMSIYAKRGAKFVIIKLAEGYYPSAGGATAHAKVSSALANNMMVMGYHFYHYNGSISDAQHQAQVAIDAAKAAGVPLNSYIALDWESESGRGENCGSTAENTQEALAWMRAVRQAGYLPMLYTGTAYLNAHFNKNAILNEFPGSFWVAYYPYSTYNTPSYSAPMASFPSMDGIAIWQFSNDIYGLNTDGNINVLPLNFLQPETPSKPATVTTTVRLIDTDDNNKVISTQTVSGEKGSQHNINIPAHYNSSTNKVTNNGGTVDIKLTHQTEQATKNVNYEVTGGSYWIHIPDNLLRKYPTIATGPLYHATKPITLKGTKDLVTGQTTWNAEPKPEDVFKSIINNNPHPDYGTVVTHPDSSNPHSIYINTVYDYNKLTDAQKQEIFPESVQSSSASNTPVDPNSSAQSSSASSSTPSSDVQSSSASSSTSSSDVQSSSANSNTPSSSAQPTTPAQVHDTTNYANKVLSDPNIGSLQDIGFHKEHAGQSSYQVGNIYYHTYNNGAVIFGSTNPNDDLFTNPKFRSQWTNTEHPEAYIKDGNKVTNITWDAHHSAVDGHIDYNQQVEEHVLNNTPTTPSSSATSNSSISITPSSANSSSTVSNTLSSDVQSSSAIQSSTTPSDTPSSAIPSSVAPSDVPSSAIPSSSAIQPSSVSVTPSDVSSSATSSSTTPQAQSSSSATNTVTSTVTNNVTHNNVPNNASAKKDSNNNDKAAQVNGVAPNSNISLGVLNNNLAQTNTANNQQNNGLALMMLGTSTLLVGIRLNKSKLE